MLPPLPPTRGESFFSFHSLGFFLCHARAPPSSRRSVSSRIYRLNGLLYLFFMFIRKRNILMGKDFFFSTHRLSSARGRTCFGREKLLLFPKRPSKMVSKRASNIFAAAVRTCCRSKWSVFFGKWVFPFVFRGQGGTRPRVEVVVLFLCAPPPSVGNLFDTCFVSGERDFKMFRAFFPLHGQGRISRAVPPNYTLNWRKLNWKII